MRVSNQNMFNFRVGIFFNVFSRVSSPLVLSFPYSTRYSATASSSSSQHYGQSIATPGPQRGNPLISPMTSNAAQGRDRHFFPADETLPHVPEGALGMWSAIMLFSPSATDSSRVSVIFSVFCFTQFIFSAFTCTLRVPPMLCPSRRPFIHPTQVHVTYANPTSRRRAVWPPRNSSRITPPREPR